MYKRHEVTLAALIRKGQMRFRKHLQMRLPLSDHEHRQAAKEKAASKPTYKMVSPSGQEFDEIKMFGRKGPYW